MSAAAVVIVFGALAPSVRQEVGLLFAAGITLLGAWMCWHAPRQQMSIEENTKDGRITAEQARKRIRIVSIAGPVVTLAGFALIAAVLLG